MRKTLRTVRHRPPRIEDDGPLSDDPSGNAFKSQILSMRQKALMIGRSFPLRHLIYPRVCVLKVANASITNEVPETEGDEGPRSSQVPSPLFSGEGVGSSQANTGAAKGRSRILNGWFAHLKDIEEKCGAVEERCSGLQVELSAARNRIKELEHAVSVTEARERKSIEEGQKRVQELLDDKQRLTMELEDLQNVRAEETQAHIEDAEKWKRREAALVDARHKAMVDARCHEDRLQEQRTTTTAAIAAGKRVKEEAAKKMQELEKAFEARAEEERSKAAKESARMGEGK